MKTQLGLITLLAVSAIMLLSQGSSDLDLSNLQQTSETQIYNEFLQWNTKHKKSVSDIVARFPIFLENYLFIQQENAKNQGFQLGLTSFADMTNEEFQARISGYKSAPEEIQTFETSEKSNLKKFGKKTPGKVDWVAKGVVGDVFNQGSCGSCWAFSVAQTLSSLNAIQNGNFVQLSQQQLVSCDHSLMLNNGCNGGNPYLSFAFYAKNNGLESAEDYPYVQQNNQEVPACTYKKDLVQFKNSGAKSIAGGDVQAIKDAVAQHPISIGINGGSIYFQLYNGGVLDSEKCKDQLDHAVNIVGYDATAETPYWNIKNSWGADWGENGYARLKIVEGNGICGCQAQPSYATA